MKENIEFKKVREFGELIGDTLLFLKQNFKPLMTSFLLLWGIFALGTMVSSIIAQMQMFGAVTEGPSPRVFGNSPFKMFYNFGINYAIVMAFMILSYTAMYVSVLSYIAVYIQKGNVAPTVAEVWAYFKFYFLRVLGSGFLMTLLLAIGFAFCIIPGIWIFPAFSLFFPIMIMENGTLSYSFERSFKILKDEWWITAATFLVIWIITYACTMVIQVPSTIIAMASSFMHSDRPFTGSTYAIVTAVSSTVSQIFLIIPIIASALIYFNLIERKESSGLFNRIDSLGQQPNSTSTVQHTPEEY